MSRRKIYFSRLWKQDKFLFYAFGFFTCFTLLFNILGDQVTPFFVWGMYSSPQVEQDYYSYYAIYLDGERFNYAQDAPDLSRSMITTPLEKYEQMEELGQDVTQAFFEERSAFLHQRLLPIFPFITNDREAMEQFPCWLLRYCSYVRGKAASYIEVKKVFGKYEKGKFVPLSNENLIREGECQ